MSNFFVSVPAQNAHKMALGQGGAFLGYQFPDRLFLGDAGQALAAWRHQTP